MTQEKEHSGHPGDRIPDTTIEEHLEEIRGNLSDSTESIAQTRAELDAMTHRNGLFAARQRLQEARHLVRQLIREAEAADDEMGLLEALLSKIDHEQAQHARSILVWNDWRRTLPSALDQEVTLAS